MSEINSMPYSPLDGVVVVSIGEAAAGHLACSFLSDLGAEVIRVERPGSGDELRHRAPYQDGLSLSWPIITRSSKSATCNLSDRDGTALLRRLIDRADVLCESLGAGELEKLDLELEQSSSSPVVIRISGYGLDGPYRDYPADDLTASAYAGLSHLTGHRDGPPEVLGAALAEYTCGALAAQAASAALLDRLDTGVGATIDASLYGGILRITEWAVPSADLLNIERRREGNYPRNAAPLGVYVSKDDQFVTIIGGSDANFRRLVQAMGEPEKATDDRYDTPSKRAIQADELNEEVRVWSRGLSVDEIESVCIANGVPFGRVYEAHDIKMDEHFHDRGDLVSVADSRGNRRTQPSPYPTFSGHGRSVPTASSDAGTDNDYVWFEIARISAEELAMYQSGGII